MPCNGDRCHFLRSLVNSIKRKNSSVVSFIRCSYSQYCRPVTPLLRTMKFELGDKMLRYSHHGMLYRRLYFGWSDVNRNPQSKIYGGKWWRSLDSIRITQLTSSNEFYFVSVVSACPLNSVGIIYPHFIVDVSKRVCSRNWNSSMSKTTQ